MNLMDLFIKIGVDDQASGSINQLTSFSIAKGNLMADAFKKGLSAMVDLGKQSIMTYADFEQLQGGIKKLFGDEAMNTVMKNADKAYKTAGMSANQYLETTTSFAASLIAGLEGDTKKAAELSDMAIKDMSDNANTFGSDISTIQNAYQGFAKQNYTMLDNLRLGYGGTASEMARLINDSGVLGDKVTVTASNLNRVSFDKMIEAIHAIQEEMGITGTTEAEAGGTIAGSLNQTKAAWDDLMVAMINDPEHVTEKWNAFANSFGNSAAKIWEAVKNIGRSLGVLAINALPGDNQDIAKRLLDDGLINTFYGKDKDGSSVSAFGSDHPTFDDFMEIAQEGIDGTMKEALGSSLDFAKNIININIAGTASASGAAAAEGSATASDALVAPLIDWTGAIKDFAPTETLAGVATAPGSATASDFAAAADSSGTEFIVDPFDWIDDAIKKLEPTETLPEKGKYEKNFDAILGAYGTKNAEPGFSAGVGSSIVVNINGAQYSSEEELAEVVARKLGQMIDGKGAVKGYAY